MDLETARFLLTPEGRGLIAAAEDLLRDGSDTARGVLRLRKRAGSGEIASAAWTVADGRRRARAKFGDLAARIYTVPEALEQATGSRAAAYHAARFLGAGFQELTDLTGGIGGDALAFAAAGLRVTLVERDPVRALFAAENIRAAGLSDRITVAEADAADFEVRTPAVWLDPARRIDSRRVVDPESYSPPLSLIERLSEGGAAGIGVKLAPAVDAGVVGRYGGSLEYLSDAGECKEALLWTGALRRDEPVSAVLLTDAGALRMAEGAPLTPGPSPAEESGRRHPSEGRLGRGETDGDEGDPAVGPAVETAATSGSPSVISRPSPTPVSIASRSEVLHPFSPLREKGPGDKGASLPVPDGAGGGLFLYEPDPAVIRARLVERLGARLGASPVDPRIAYLVGPRLVETPWADAYEIVDRMPYRPRNLQRALNERGVGRVVVKKRGVPIEPEDVARRLTLTGKDEMTLVLTQIGLQRVVFLCRRVRVLP